jgi:hypothetical protein
MFYIVESDSQLKYLCNLGRNGGYVEVVTTNDRYHPMLSSAVALYIRPLDHKEGYILPIDHEEGLNLEKSRVQELLKCYDILYTFNKKNFLYFFSHSNINDINLMYSMVEYDTLRLPDPPQTIQWYYNRMSEKKDLNRIIPLAKLHERCERSYNSLIEIVENYQDILKDSSWPFYNNLATGVFYLSEYNGVRITYEEFIDKFKPNNPSFSIADNICYTSYNLYNPTSRPTSAFNSVNFAAIPKKEEFRKAIIPRNDRFIEFDFDGYHIRLVAEAIGYQFTSESVHTQLGRLYFDKQELTEEEYKQSKQNTFQIMYGGVPDKYRHIEFFDKVASYINEMWTRFTVDGVVRAPISNKPFYSNLKDMNPQKLFNYVIQSLETSRNILILKEVLGYLKDKKSGVALYTYDAILFDFDLSDGKETLEELKRLLETSGKYPVKYKSNTNLVLD